MQDDLALLGVLRHIDPQKMYTQFSSAGDP